MDADHVMDNIRKAFERSGLTLSELGEGLGYHRPTAKKRAWVLLHRTPDPRISTVLLSPNARCQDRRPGEVMSRRSHPQTLNLVPFVAHPRSFRHFFTSAMKSRLGLHGT